MIGVLLLLMVEGIGVALAASDGRAVTARWQRLGGLIALALLAVAWTIRLRAIPGAVPGAVPGVVPGALTGALPGAGAGDGMVSLPLLAAATAAAAAQLTLAQLGRRQWQRAAAALVVLAAGACACAALHQTLGAAAEQAGLAGAPGPAGAGMTGTAWPDTGAATWLNAGAATLLSGSIMGGFLMTMLLGHAYLTAGNEMTQRPFARLVMLMGALIAARAMQSGLTALLPWWRDVEQAWPGAGGFGHAWTTMMIVARYLVGLALPAVFTWMTYDCVKRRANQSATGILYVAGVLVIIGEGAALALMGATGRAF